MPHDCLKTFSHFVLLFSSCLLLNQLCAINADGKKFYQVIASKKSGGVAFARLLKVMVNYWKYFYIPC